jgi:hypothetical protein
MKFKSTNVGDTKKVLARSGCVPHRLILELASINVRNKGAGDCQMYVSHSAACC